MPCDGTLTRMIHVPGALFSVNPTTARGVPGLFARNERVVCVFESPAVGSFVLTLVGATIVGSMATVWHGVVNPPRVRRVREWHYADAAPSPCSKGEEMGRFMLGSTVVLLFRKSAGLAFNPAWEPGGAIRLGEAMADRAERRGPRCAPSSSMPTPRCARSPSASARKRCLRSSSPSATPTSPPTRCPKRSPARRSRSSTTPRCRSRWRAAAPACSDVVFLGTGARSYMDPEALAGARHRRPHHQGLRRHGGRRMRDRPAVRRRARLRRRWTAAMRDGRWLRSEGTQLTGKTLGLIGFGGIAAEVARLALGIGMKVLAWNRTPKAQPASSSWRSSGCSPRATRSRCTCC